MSTLSGGWSAFRNARHGPWLVGSNLYALTTAGVQKSTNGGTSWSQVAAFTSAASVAGDYAAGTHIHIMVHTSGTNVDYYWFDTSTDSLGTAVPRTNAANAGTGAVHIAVAAIDDTTAVVAYQSATATIMGQQYRRITYGRLVSGANSGGWVSLTANDQVHYDLSALVRGSSGRAHFLYLSSGTPTPLRHRTLTSAGSLITEQTVVNVSPGNYPVGVPWFDGTNIYVPYIENSGTDRVSIAKAASADSPTWTTETIGETGNAAEIANSNPAALTHDGTDWHAFWVYTLQTSIFRDQTTSGAWGTDATFLSSLTAVQGINIAHVGSGTIGVLYSDNGTVTYATLSGGTPATLTVVTATAPAQAEAVAFDANVAASLAVVTATAPAQGEAVNLASATPATFAAGTATAPTAGEASTLTGAARLTITPAPAPAQGEAVLFDANVAATLTVTSATAPAQGEAVTLNAAQAASLTIASATAPATAASTLTGAGALTITSATAPAAGGAVILDANVAASLAVTPASAPAAGEAVALGAAASATFTITPADAPAAGEAVILDGNVAAALVLTSAGATATGEAVTLPGQARLGITPASAPAQADGISFDAAARFLLATVAAAATGGSVSLTAGGTATFTIGPATTTATAPATLLTGAGALGITPGGASAGSGAITLTGATAARLLLGAAPASALAELVALLGMAAVVHFQDPFTVPAAPAGFNLPAAAPFTSPPTPGTFLVPKQPTGFDLEE